MADKIWVASITHSYGTDLYAARTKKGLLRQIHAYVEEWWEDEGLGTEMPHDTEEAISEYFERVEDEQCDYEEVEMEE
ncbi:hypothetical protein ACUN0C_18735 [Faunimonas sp. B44]|uniref:hypothetical protein n=1 Tax=Faunimonas sp. B44 TaxID=3461493 RepID=UPI0040446593